MAIRQRPHKQQVEEKQGDNTPVSLPSTFKHLMQSKDGKLCLFQDDKGHLVAVRSSRLA